MRIAILALVLTACSPQVVFVYADAGPQPQGDAATPADDAYVGDAGVVHADAALYSFACEPYRAPGSISQTDCDRYPARPVCDALVYDQHTGSTPTCVAPPTSWCGACESDDQCRSGVDVRADCVYLPSTPSWHYADQACLSPCVSDSDCAFLDGIAHWTGTHASCLALPRGSYCVVPAGDGTPTCSDFMGGRR